MMNGLFGFGWTDTIVKLGMGILIILVLILVELKSELRK